MKGLTDKVALVTGGSSGIGEACARRLAEEGCKVMVAGRDEARTKAVAESLTSPESHAWMTADVLSVADCRAMVTATLERYGRLDVLVHCSGVSQFFRTLDMTEDDWDRIIDINLKGAFFTMQAALAPMVEAKSGVIVVIASDSGHHSEPDMAAYGASKAGLISLVQTFAKDHGRDGVRVCAVSPACIETPMLWNTYDSGFDHCTNQIGATPLGRAGFPEEVANVVAFLASDEGSYCSGDSWLVDGGLTA